MVSGNKMSEKILHTEKVPEPARKPDNQSDVKTSTHPIEPNEVHQDQVKVKAEPKK
jgi:hypothetical protein